MQELYKEANILDINTRQKFGFVSAAQYLIKDYHGEEEVVPSEQPRRKLSDKELYAAIRRGLDQQSFFRVGREEVAKAIEDSLMRAKRIRGTSSVAGLVKGEKYQRSAIRDMEEMERKAGDAAEKNDAFDILKETQWRAAIRNGLWVGLKTIEKPLIVEEQEEILKRIFKQIQQARENTPDQRTR